MMKAGELHLIASTSKHFFNREDEGKEEEVR